MPAREKQRWSARQVRELIAALAVLLAITPAAVAGQKAPGGADSLNSLAMQAYQEGTRAGLERSIELWAQAAKAYGSGGNHAAVAVMLNNIGFVHSDLSRPDSALAYFVLSLPIARAVGDRIAEAGTLSNIGLTHGHLGALDSALAYYGQALAIQRAVRDRTGEAVTLNNIGLAHSDVGRSDSALAYYAQALPIQRAVGDRPREAATLSNIGLAHHRLGRPGPALEYYALALRIERAVRNRSGEASALMNMGTALRDLRRPDSALTYYAQALPILRDVGNRRGEAMTLNNIGGVHHDLSEPDSALAYYAQALPIQRVAGDRSGEALTLGNIGISHQDRGGPARFLAVAYYDSAAAVLATIADRAGDDRNRLSFGEQSVRLFQHWALAWLDLGSEVDTRSANLAALAAAERGRAQAMLDLMRASAAEAAGNVGAGSATTRAGVDLSEEGERLVRSLAASGSASISYLVTPDALAVWLTLPDGEVDVFRVHVTEQALAAAVAALRTALGVDLDPTARPPSRDEASEVAGRLAAWLIPPELFARLPVAVELVIVPHGALNLVPFAALPIGPSDEPLGARYALRFSPSLSTLVEIGARGTGTDAAQARARALVVGDPTMPEVRDDAGAAERLEPLPGAKAEGRWVANQLDVRLLTEGEATESRIRELLPRATLVHLATHGYAYATEALARQSFIALAPDAEHDGLLTVGEVLDEIPSLSAELVVLSACETGLGDLKQAEGTVGLQRAFLAKGARSVMVSLWSVSDEATDLLMRNFYRNWLSGKPKAEALRRAQEEVRATPGFSDPLYWAAFQLVGA